MKRLYIRQNFDYTSLGLSKRPLVDVGDMLEMVYITDAEFMYLLLKYPTKGKPKEAIAYDNETIFCV